MSAIDGSNFEKKWIYAHQISTFTNNFLNIYLLEKYAQILLDKELKDYKLELERLLYKCENCLIDAGNKGEEDIKNVKKSMDALRNKIQFNFLEEPTNVFKYLDGSPDAKCIKVLDGLYETLITYQKAEGEINKPVESLIDKIVEKKKTLTQESYDDLLQFNTKYLPLRGKEIQCFWDIVAMCEEKTIMGHHFYMSSDEDLVALYKQEYLGSRKQNANNGSSAVIKSQQEFAENFEYLLKRNFMRCMWKSYPEHEFYFQDWTDEEHLALNEFLKPCTVPAGFEYLVLSDTIGENRTGDQQKEFWKYLKETYKLKRFVSVNQVIKTKQFIPYETYLKRGNQVLRLEDIGLCGSEIKDEKFRFFYYEQNPDGKKIDIVEILNWLRAKIAVNMKKKLKIGYFEESEMKRDIIIRDNIYGNIRIPYKMKQLIDCKEFQRLRRISQLATAGQIFPGAVQNRFSHSLGVFYLMNRIVEHFERKLKKIGYHNSIQEIEKDGILVAALLHDIGHGPFSHAFEQAGINREKHSHEEWTEKIITSEETDINATLIALWGKGFPDLVMSYINCRKNVKEGHFEQINNAENGLNLKFIFASLVSSQLDADRMDYLLRDSRACGVTYGQFDIDRLIEGMSIAINSRGELKVGVEEEYLTNVEEYFYARYMMYDNVYYHPFKMLTETLLQNILKAACDLYIGGILKPDKLPPVLADVFNHSAMSMSDFCNLDDHVVFGAIQIWAGLEEKESEQLSDLCKCFLDRRGYQKLNILNTEDFCKKLKKESAYPIDLLAENSDRCDFIYCRKEILMYNTDKKDDVYIIKNNGTIVNLQDVRKIKNVKSVVDALYHSIGLTGKFYPKDKDLIGQLVKEFNLNKSVEIEKKYILEPNVDKNEILQELIGIIKEKNYTVEECGSKKQEDVYYDTDSMTLEKNEFSVRVRDCGTEKFLTCKYKIQSESNGDGGQLERFEAERKINSRNLQENIDCVDDSVLTLLRQENYSIGDLSGHIRVINNRDKYIFYKESNDKEDERYELVMDDVTYVNLSNQREAKEVQIEIELKSGYETRINMKALTDSIGKIEGIRSITESKYRRALKLTESGNPLC